jgi:protein ImuB
MTMLARIESGATWLELILIRLDASPVQATIRLSRASRDARHLWSLLRPRIERMNLGYGIERIVLRARAARRLPHDQLEQPYGGGEHDRAAVDRASGELIDTLVHRLGRERALRISVHESHRPERVTQHVSAMDHIPSATATVAIAEGDRPSQLFETPEPVEAMALTPDGPPTSLRWRGEQLSIIAAHGPHRISGEWWNGSADRAARDYFKVQDADGRWLWVFRDLERGRWFVHGEWA